MAITLGKDGGTAIPAVGGVTVGSVISATFTDERELIDVTNRTNIGGSAGAPGYRVQVGGFRTRTWEIETHDPTSLITALEAAPASGQYTVMSVVENVTLDGAVTYTVTAKEA